MECLNAIHGLATLKLQIIIKFRIPFSIIDVPECVTGSLSLRQEIQKAHAKSNLGRMSTGKMRAAEGFPGDHREQWEASVPVLGLYRATPREGALPKEVITLPAFAQPPTSHRNFNSSRSYMLIQNQNRFPTASSADIEIHTWPRRSSKAYPHH